MDLMLLLANLTVVLLLLGFIAIYHARAPWWASPHGRSIVSMKAAVLAVAVGELLRRFDQDDIADRVVLVGWIAVAVVMLWRTWMLWHDTTGDREAIRQRLLRDDR